MKKYLLPLLLILGTLFPPEKSYATHAAGGELIYVHVTGSTYQYFFKFYRDCTGAPAPGSVDLCFYESCTGQTFTRQMNRWTGTLPPDNRPNGSPVSTGCSTFPTKCESATSTIDGYEEWWYSLVETLPSTCNSWTFGASINARNPSVNLTTQPRLYIETQFDNTISTHNSSPFFSVKPIPYVCVNRPYAYNNGAVDPDNDSLWSVVTNPLQATTCAIRPPAAMGSPTNGGGLAAGVTFPNNPIFTGNTFVLNGGNGQMNFTANQTGAQTLTVRTTEYRNGAQIGYIMRDVQVQVIPCNTVAPDLDVDGSSVKGGDYSNSVVSGCMNQTLEFCFDVTTTATAPPIILLADDNLTTAIPSANINYVNQGTDSVRGCFSWTPGPNDVGSHNFIVIVKDSSCKPPGVLLQYAHVIDLYVWGPIETTPDTNICNGQPAYLGASKGGNYQWSVVTGTPNSVAPTTGPNVTATPTATTVYAVQSNINNYCPDLNKDTVTVTVEQGPPIGGQADTTTCPDSPTPLDVKVVEVPGVNYTIQWAPVTGLTSTTIQNPTATLKSDIQYIVTIGSSINRCQTYDTINVNVLDGFSIENPDTAICRGDKVPIRGTGDGAYTYRWESPNTLGVKFDPAVIFSSGSTLLTDIEPSDTGTYVYRIIASYAAAGNSCPDSSVDIEINVQPIPSVVVSDDDTLCFGDTLTIKSVTQPDSYNKYTYDWVPGASLDFPDRPEPIYTANIVGDNRLTLTVSTPAGCSDSDSIGILVYPGDFLTVPNDTAICPGDSIALRLTVPDKTIYYWAPDFNINNTGNLQPVVWPITDQVYTVYGVDTSGCKDTNSVYVTVRPRAVMHLPDSVTIYPGEHYRMDPGGNALYYTWFPQVGLDRANIADPIASPKVNTRYIVQARTEAGCNVTDSVTVYVKNDSYLDLPNAFTPGHRNNSMLKIIRRGDAELKNFTVYNRWGEKVFQTSDINQGWDGTIDGNKQPMGVYIYSIEAITPSGRTFNKQGNITLIR